MHKYQLCVHHKEIGNTVVLPAFPELNIRYEANSNTICPIHYGEQQSTTCTRQGDVSITFRVNERHLVTMHGADERNDHALVIGEYEFIGRGVEILNESREQTFLNFTVRRYIENSGCDSGPYGTETRTYRVGEKFILQFTETGGTGRTYKLMMHSVKGVVLLQEKYIPHCKDTYQDDQRPDCANTHQFLMKGVQHGHFFIDAVYCRFWEDDEEKRKVGQKTRRFEIIIL